MTRLRRLGGTVAVAAIALWGEPANAQAGGEPFLAEASSEGTANCPVVTLRFTVPVRFNGTASPEPSVTRLRVEPATPGNFAARDQLSVPAGATLIGSISWERDAPGGETLIVTFTAPTRVEVGLGNDSQSIVLNLQNNVNSSGCGAPIAPSVAPPGLTPEVLDPAELAKLQGEAEGALLR
jgi:hypothetical protein